MATAISRAALARSIAAGSVVVVEALGADFYRNGHLPNAVNLSLSSPDAVVRRVVDATDRPIVVYGTAGGGEAAELAHRIERLCGREVSVYAGGKEDWAEAGLPIEGTGQIAPSRSARLQQ